ncbi:MAG: M48 family metalloprotease, partial [Xanthomonadales bacterium]|nr:M48 family metalloprotease [Xanthomonadales bacterium]
IGTIAGMVLIDSKVDSSAGKQAAALIPQIGAQLITRKYGRDAEREADYYGMIYMSEAGYDPKGAVELQETFVRLSEGRADDWLSGLFASHPPSRERVERNRETLEELPAGGEDGRARYLDATRYIREVKPAYDAYDEALKAASEDRFGDARKSVERALDIEPREALFHALVGDLHAHEEHHRRAYAAFDRAVDRNGQFFYHRLRRGQMALELGRKSQARDDIAASLDMLPTARGHYLMGNLERDAGDIDSARAHYQQAAQSDSESGRLAQRELVRMDIGNQPGQFIATAPAQANDGRVYCLIGNRTSVPIGPIRLRAAFVDSNGQVRRADHRYSSVLEGGRQDRVATQFVAQLGTDIARRAQCEVTAAGLPD